MKRRQEDLVGPYLAELRPTNDQRTRLVRALVDQLMPARRYRWQLWRHTETDRYRFAFELVNLIVLCRR